MPDLPRSVTFVTNDLRAYEPALAARFEAEIIEAAGASDEAGSLECRVTERDQDGRARITVSLSGKDWTAGFSVSQPTAIGEVRSETRKALRDRDRRVPNYQRSKRR